MKRRGFVKALIALPAALKAALSSNVTKVIKPHEFNPMTNHCKRCGMTALQAMRITGVCPGKVPIVPWKVRYRVKPKLMDRGE